MTTITMQARYAVDIQPFQGTEETRYYLSGFFVEANEAGGIRVVATDGHALAVFHDALGKIEGEPRIIRLNKGVLAAIKAAKKDYRYLEPWLVIDAKDDDASNCIIKVCVSGQGGKDDAPGFQPDHKVVATFTDAFVVVGTFPDYHRVIPHKTAANPSPFLSFNKDNLARFGALAAKDSHGYQAATVIQSDGAGDPCRVFVPDRPDFFGVIMPMHRHGTKAEEFATPAWFPTPSWAKEDSSAEDAQEQKAA